MNPAIAAPGGRAAWHFWLIGALALLWNCIGAFDYVMTQTRNTSYLAAFTREQLDYFFGFPWWVVAAWAFGVWGGVAGAALLLLRRRLAVPALAVSLGGIVVTTLHNFVLSNGLAVMGGAGGAVFPAVILVVAIALLLYARRQARAGVLR